MSRFASNSLYSKWHTGIEEIGKREETNRDPQISRLNSGDVVGIEYSCILPLISGLEWRGNGQIQCVPQRYLDFNIQATDMPGYKKIHSFSIAIYVCDGLQSADVDGILGDAHRADLQWEYESEELAEGKWRWRSLHVHKIDTAGDGATYSNVPNPMTMEFYLEILEDTITAIKNPETWWTEFLQR